MDEKARASLLMAGVPRTAKVIEIGTTGIPWWTRTSLKRWTLCGRAGT